MATPVRDDGSPGPTRRLIVLVHGFNSSAATWQPLRRLLEQDAAVTAEFDIRCFSYATALGAMPILRRLPSLDEAGRSLASELKELVGTERDGAYIDVTLVGHSMGGLIIQSCLLTLLAPDGSARTLDHIRQVILFATPNFGSVALGWLRSVFFALTENPQERALRLFSAESTRVHEAIRDRVIFARRRARDEYPIPFHCFWGLSDAIVPAESARGHFPAGEPLPGDHSTVHCPAARDHQAYRHFVGALRFPHGHPNIWEIDQFTMRVKVTPQPPGTETVARHGTKQRIVVHDNVAAVTRQVVFSRHNHCREPYVLKYGTRNGGWIVPRISEPHITPADKLRLYDDNGCDAYYEVAPVPGGTATLDLIVYKGFDAGHRDYHMHLGRSSNYRRVRFDLDLSDYRRGGWRIREPQLYFHPTDPGDHMLCAERAMINPDPPIAADPDGRWQWELEFVKEGVVDVVWDVEQPAPVTATAPAPEIRLGPGEHAVFGYGSLLSIASLERTLGRTYTGPFVVCSVDGWRRTWNVSMPNDAFVYREQGRWVTPAKIFYLNVEPDAGRAVNGVLFVVNDEELRRFDAREWIYDRVDVSARLRGVEVTGGQAWLYQGKPAHVSAHPPTPEGGAVRRTYLEIISQGHRALGEPFVRAYEASTDPVPLPIVVDDVRRNEM